MDAVARVEARIFEVQARFARAAAVAPPARATTAASSAATSTSGTARSATVQNGTSAPNASFRDLANAALRSIDATGSPSASYAATRSPGSFGPVRLPASLAGLTNGRLPDTVLEPIGQGTHRLERSAAVAFRRMAAAAADDGVTLTVSDSYRSLAAQTRTAGDVGLYRDGGLAAVPGTSTHGWGLSVDLETDPSVTRWLRANANRFGFAEDVAREPWHYTYRPADL